MSEANGTANGTATPSANSTAKQSRRERHERLAKKRNPTEGYQPNPYAAWWGYSSSLIDGAPFFTWMDVPRMLRDPQVQFVLRMWRSPFQQVRWKIEGSSDRVKRFADETLRHLWRQHLPRLLARYSQYGFACGGVEFTPKRGLLRATQFTRVEPFDCRPLVWSEGRYKGRAAGFTIQANGRQERVLLPHAVWFAGNREWGQFYDFPVLAGMFEPWLEKRGRNGAIHSRRLWFRKCAFNGIQVRYPAGISNIGSDENPQYRNNQDIAREMQETFETGGLIAAENTVHPSDPAKYAWEFTQPEARPDVTGIREYAQDLDREMLSGAGIPPEVVEASEVGSGWSGRMIPLLAFYGGTDELTGPLIDAFTPAVQYAVETNFGRGVWFEVQPIPLVEQVKEAAQSGPGGGEGPNPVQDAMAGRPIGGGTSPGNPVSMSVGLDYPRNRNGSRNRNPNLPSGRPVSRRISKAAKRSTRLRHYREEFARELSWMRHEGDRGGKGWKNTETGEVRYQESKPSDEHSDGTPRFAAVKRRIATARAVGKLVDGKLERNTMAYRIGKHALHKIENGMMVLMRRTQVVAQQAARERGLPEEHVERVGRVMAAIDFAASFGLSKSAAIATGGNLAAGFAAGMLPSASIAYLAYSTARNPRATLRAAKKYVRGELATMSQPQPHAMSFGGGGSGGDASGEQAAMLFDYFDGVANHDWAEAVLSAALDSGRPLPEAIDVARRVLTSRPNGPRGGGPRSLSAMGDDGNIPPKLIEEAMFAAVEQHGEDPEALEAILEALASLGSNPQELQKILGGLELSWESYQGPKGGKGWKNSETGRVIYGGNKPGERKEKQQASAKRARELTSKVLHHEHTPEDLKELATHLPALSKAELRSARLKMGARFGGGQRRTQMVNALLAHVTELDQGGSNPPGSNPPATEPKRKPLTGAAAAMAKREDGTPHAPKVEDVHTVPTDSLHVDPERFQYKVSGIGKDGVGQELKGTKTWNPELGGTLLVWRDPQDGKDYVVNGHHRRELAGRVGQKSMNVRYIQAEDARIARAKGALANIAEGRGTAIDAAKYMRDTGSSPADLQAAGVSLTGRIAADATTLTKLNPSAFQRLAEGRLNESIAVAVAKHLDDPKLQEALFKKLDQREEDGKEWTTRQIETAARKMANAGKVVEKGEDLFGMFEDEKSTFEQEVEIEEFVSRMLAQQVNDFAAVANQKRAGRVADAGNVLAVDENQRRREQAEQVAEVFHKQAGLKGPIAEAVKASASKLATAKTKKEKDNARTEAVERVREAIGRELGIKPVGADTRGTSGSGEGRTENP